MPSIRRPVAADPDDQGIVSIPGSRAMLSTDDPESESEFELSPGERIAAMLEGIADGEKVSIRLYRRIANSNNLPWCQNYNPEEFQNGDFEMIRRDWGAGEYQIRVYEAGHRGMRQRFDFSIEARAGNPIPVSGGNTELATILKSMQESQAAMLTALSQRPDPMAQLQQTAELFKSLGLVGGAAAPAAPAPSPLETVTQMAGMFRAMKDLSGEINPPKEADPDNPMSMLPGIIDVVKLAMGNRGNDAAPILALPGSIADAQAPMIEAPQPNPAAPAESDAGDPDQLESEQMQLVQMLVRNYLSRLLKLAAASRPAAEGGRFLFDELPDEFLDQLGAENWFDQLAAFDPRVLPYRIWIETAKIELDRLMAEDAAAP